MSSILANIQVNVPIPAESEVVFDEAGRPFVHLDGLLLGLTLSLRSRALINALAGAVLPDMTAEGFDLFAQDPETQRALVEQNDTRLRLSGELDVIENIEGMLTDWKQVRDDLLSL